MAVEQKEPRANSISLPLEDPEAQLSFYRRHFQKPIGHDVSEEDYYKPENRHFSFLSRGSLLCAAMGVVICITIFIAVLATSLDHKRKEKDTLKHPSPISLALLDNFPDPSIILNDGTWYAFGTNDAAGILRQPGNATATEYGLSNVQLAISTDFQNWTLLDNSHDPLPRVGEWALQGLNNSFPHVPVANVWAPAILQRPIDNKFVLYYSAVRSNATHAHCVGAAISTDTTPAGPFTPLNTTIACPVDGQGGAIDPAAFVDKDNSIYMAWKVDGNNVGHGGECGNTVPPLQNTPIMLQKMMDDGFTPNGSPITILNRTAADGPLVEAPALVRSHEGVYFLFFSSGCTRQPSYDLKYAYASKVTGPYTRAKAPLLATGDWGLLAPGSVGIGETSTGGWEMAFHARVYTDYGGVRAMFTAGIEFNGTIVNMLAPKKAHHDR